MIETKTGSMAGTPLADLAYILAMSRVMYRLRERLVDEGLVSSLPIDVKGKNPKLTSRNGGSRTTEARPTGSFRNSGSRSTEAGPVWGSSSRDSILNDIGYVDDSALVVTSEARTLVMKTTKVAACACEVFATFGMAANFKAGKSEAMASWRGKAARTHKRLLAKTGNVSTFNFNGKEIELRFVDVYKYLGTATEPNMHEAKEVSVRAAIIKSETRALRKHVLANKHAPLATKVNMAQSYIWSKGLFQCGTWSSLSGAQYKSSMLLSWGCTGACCAMKTASSAMTRS